MNIVSADNPAPDNFNSPAWREERDRKLHGWLKDPAAVEFVLAVGNWCEVFDDCYDGDPVEQGDALRAVRDCFFALEHNAFWQAHRPALTFLLEQYVLSWETANHLEKSEHKLARERAYFLRDAPVFLIPAVAGMLHGYDHALKVSCEVWAFTPHEGVVNWEYYDAIRQ